MLFSNLSINSALRSISILVLTGVFLWVGDAKATEEKIKLFGIRVIEERDDSIGKKLKVPEKRILPKVWLALEEETARYELTIVLHSNVLQECRYTEENMRIRQRIDAEVSIRDLVHDREISKDNFQGSNPDKCPLTIPRRHKDVRYISGLPSLADFYQWFLRTMLKHEDLPRFTGLLVGYPFRNVRFSPDGKQIITLQLDETVRFWDPKTGLELKKIECDYRPHGAEFSFDGQFIATHGVDKLNLWDAKTAKKIMEIGEIEGWIQHIRFSPDGKLILLSTHSHKVYVIDTQTDSKREISTSQGIGQIKAIDWYSNGSHFITASVDKSIRIWSASMGKQRLSLRLERKPANAAFSPDGAKSAISSQDQKLRIWDLKTGKLLMIIDDNLFANPFHFSPDGKYLIIAKTMKRSVDIWDISKGTLVGTIDSANSLADAGFSPDQKYIYLVSNYNLLVNLYRVQDLLSLP
jgi:WD40 repeat protein